MSPWPQHKQQREERPVIWHPDFHMMLFEYEIIRRRQNCSIMTCGPVQVSVHSFTLWMLRPFFDVLYVLLTIHCYQWVLEIPFHSADSNFCTSVNVLNIVKKDLEDREGLWSRKEWKVCGIWCGRRWWIFGKREDYGMDVDVEGETVRLSLPLFLWTDTLF